MLDVRHLRQIIAVHQAGSFAKAAELLGIAQPSLSNSVARLEDKLGIKIFQRTAGGSRLTPIGEMLLARAPKVIAEADDLLRDAALVANGEGGEIRLGFGTALRDCFLPKLMVQIAENHPQLRLSATTSSASILIPSLASRQLDVVICARHADLGGLPFTPIFACDFIAAVSPAHPLAHKREVRLDEMLQYRCAGSPYRYRNSVVLGVDEGHDRATAYRGDDFSALAHLALAGLCVLVAPSCAVHDDLQTGSLVPVDLDLGASVVFGAVTTPAMSLSPMVCKIIGYAVKIGSEMQPAMLPPRAAPSATGL